MRDKDGVTAALVAAELAARLKAEGRTLLDRLDELFRTHGAHVTRQHSIRLDGQRLAGPRARPPWHPCARRRPPRWPGERSSRWRTSRPGTRLPPSDVLIWTLDGARLVVRPSGTEPKLKVYAEAVVPVDDDVSLGPRAAARVVDEILAAATALLATPRLARSVTATAAPRRCRRGGRRRRRGPG